MLSRALRLACVSLGVAAGPAWADCPAANRYSFDFNTQAVQNLAYNTSYALTASNSLGQTVAVTMRIEQNDIASTNAGGFALPGINNLVNGGTGNTLALGGQFTGRTANIFANPRTIRAIFTAPAPVRDFTMTLHDVDSSDNQFRDWIAITGTNGAAGYVTALTTPFGQVNTTTGPRTNASSTVRLGPEAGTYNLDQRAAVGQGQAPNNGNGGDMTLRFVQPVTAVTVRYGNYPHTGFDLIGTGAHAIGIDGFAFCPMPVIALTKSSAPVATAGVNRFNVPDADIDYTITVSNTGGSPVDINTALIADVLPAGVTFFNGDIDAGAAGTQNFVFTPGTSGLTLAAGNIAYSNNGGTSYAYTPAAGYDPAVNALRFAPQGTMAANSSFTIRFRTRIR